MAKYKISLISRRESDNKLIEEQLAGLDYEMDVHVCASEGEAIEAVKGADVIISQGVPMPRTIIQEIDTAQAIVNGGHGFDSVDHHAATDNGIMVVNTAGFCSEEVSDHAIMMLLASAKRLVQLNNAVKNGAWQRRPQNCGYPLAHVVYGQTLGQIGLGNIGRATARKAKAFGLEVISYDPYVQPWIAKEYGVKLMSSLEDLATRSDFVSLIVPSNEETEKLVGESFFKAMKRTAYFINTSRGPTVDEQALIRALQSDEIAGAAIDVFEQEPTPIDNPLLKMDNVIVTPHTAGVSDVAGARMKVQIGQEAARILRGTLPMSLANPAVRHKMPARPAAINL